MMEPSATLFPLALSSIAGPSSRNVVISALLQNDGRHFVRRTPNIAEPIHEARSAEGSAAAPADAAGAGGSGKNAWDTVLASTPTVTPTAIVVLSCPTSACSATPATGISVNDSTRTAVRGLPVVKPKKKI